MKKLILLWLLLATNTWGADHYISPSGTDSGDCTGSNCKTFAYALAAARMPAGDRLILRDGTYNVAAGTGFPNINCASGYNNGTAGSPITVKAENERQAWLSGDSNTIRPFLIQNCSYWTVEGLRASEVDNVNASGFEVGNVIVASVCNNLTFRRLLLDKNNRYKNSHLIEFLTVNSSLVEESEFYTFHRHGILVQPGNLNTFRRNYFNSRSRADIPGGVTFGQISIDTARGDVSISLYPGSNSILENNIAEGQYAGFDIQAAGNGGGTSSDNKYFGNVSNANQYGIVFNSRGTGNLYTPTNTVLVNNVLSGNTVRGFFPRTSRNTQATNNIFLSNTGIGLQVDVEASVGAAPFSFFGTNLLAVSNTGASVDIAGQTSYGVDYLDEFGNGSTHTPASASFTHVTTTNPSLGSCKAWIPAASPMKGAGLAGADIGANVLYEYVNGVLTSVPLWNSSTNDFVGCGVVVTGVNDVAGSSCNNVDIRLAIGTANGCAFPTGYGGTPDSGGTWISIDNFDSYTQGQTINALNGGSGWTSAWTQTTADIFAQPALAGGQGGLAGRIRDDEDASFYRTFSGLSKGVARYQFLIDTITPIAKIEVSLGDSGGTRCTTSIEADGTFRVQGTSVGSYTANVQHTVDIEFDDTAQPDSCRGRMDALNFTPWLAVTGGSYTSLDRLKINSNTGFLGVFYIDDIKEGSTSTVNSTISLVDAGITGATMFVGEVKPLQWSTTDYTGNINLLASRDAGATFQTIAQNVPDTGTYNWTVTGPSTTQARIKTCLASSQTVCDTSLAFGIGGTILSVR